MRRNKRAHFTEDPTVDEHIRRLKSSAAMLRSLAQSARCAARNASRQQLAAARPLPSTSFLHAQRLAPVTSVFATRGYAASSGMSKQEVTGRIMDLLKGFDKIKDTSKVGCKRTKSHLSGRLIVYRSLLKYLTSRTTLVLTAWTRWRS